MEIGVPCRVEDAEDDGADDHARDEQRPGEEAEDQQERDHMLGAMMSAWVLERCIAGLLSLLWLRRHSAALSCLCAVQIIA